MVTLEEIKERYPEGCEVASVLQPNDKQILIHDDIKITYVNGVVNRVTLIGIHGVHLWNKTSGFATIIKPAPESKQDKPKRYKNKEVDGMDVIDLAKYWNLNFNEGNILKYLLRDKGQDADDMQKIADYAQRENKFLNNKNN